MKYSTSNHRVHLTILFVFLWIMFTGMVLQIVPDPSVVRSQNQQRMSSELAGHSAVLVESGNSDLLWRLLKRSVTNNRQLTSATVRDDKGKVLVWVGAPQKNAEPNERSAGWEQIEEPIVSQGKTLGRLTLTFQMPPNSVWLYLQRPSWLMVLFFALACFLCYLSLGRYVLDRRFLESAYDLWVPEASNDELSDDDAKKFLGETQPANEETEEGGGDQLDYDPMAVPFAPEAEKGSLRSALVSVDNLTMIERRNAHLKKMLWQLQRSQTEIRRQNKKLLEMATRDPLTGCLNRRAFFTEFECHWHASVREGYPVSCVMVDVDHFKTINDNHGHQHGDLVLQEIAKVLRDNTRRGDAICRYGGEEFAVLLPNMDIADASVLAERLRRSIFEYNPADLTTSVSVGISSIELGAKDIQELLDQADKALYIAKRSGRNRVVRWDDVADDAAFAKTDASQTSATGDRHAAAIPFQTVRALLSALEYRHPHTADHSRRVADLCVATAEGMLSINDCYLLEVAALMHDIGKLGVPDAILLKPGKLTGEEWNILRSHEIVGFELLAAAFSSDPLIQIFRCCHCRFDGSPDEPDLPSGTDIPVEARILSIANAYDAMVSDQVYRKRRSQEEAFAELRRCGDLQFDAKLVERFIETVCARDANRRYPATERSELDDPAYS